MFRIGSKKNANREYTCTIRLINDNEVIQCEFRRDHKGQYLLDYVCDSLNLVEKDYFGLRYVDFNKQRHWLDTSRSILSQVKGLQPIIFCFRVKFYSPEPHRIKEEITRYQIFLQLRRDLLHGRLYCCQADAVMLAAYIIQSELGDYDPEEHIGNYVGDFKLLLKQTPCLEEKIAEIHQIHLSGQVPAVAEVNFLHKACLQDTYGVDPHPVKDHKGNQLYLGVNYSGILTFLGSRKTHHFKWMDIQRINFEGKMFIIHLLISEDGRNKRKHLIGFKCPTRAACKHLWKCALEQQFFFMAESSAEVPSVTTGGGLFSKGSKFRYSGRVEKEVIEVMTNFHRDPPQFQRSFLRTLSFRHKSESYPTTPATPSKDYETDFPDLHYMNHSAPATENVDSMTSTDSSSLKYTNRSTQMTGSLSDLTLPEHEEVAILPLEGEEDQHIKQLESHIVEKLEDLIEEDRPAELEVSLPPLRASTPQITEEVEQETHNAQVSTSESQLTGKNFELDFNITKQKNLARSRPFLSRPVNIVRVTILASLFALLTFWCLLVVVMESDSPLFSDARKLPELIVLRREYYEPAKDYVVERLKFLF